MNDFPMTDGLAYGDPQPEEAPALAYDDVLPAGPQLSDKAIDARTSRADFALGEKSPGPQVLRDAFKTGKEDTIRVSAAAQADAEFRQDKLAAIQGLASKGAAVTGPEVEGIMAIGTIPEANPKTVLEDKFAKNFVNAGVIGEPEKNLVFQSAFDATPETTQANIRTAANVVSRNHIVRGVLEEAEAAYKEVPWLRWNDPEGGADKLGNHAKNVISGGIAAMVNQRNLLNDAPTNSFLPGKNKLEQIQYLYLLPHDKVKETLMAAVGPGSEFWKTNPVDAMQFIESAAQYSASDAFVDNVMGVANVAGFVPFGALARGIGLMRGGKAITQPMVQSLETAAKAAEDVLKTTPKRPTTSGETAQATALDVLSGSSKPVEPGYYLPSAAVQRPWEATPRLGEMRVEGGKPRVFTDDGAEVALSRTPEVGHYPLSVDKAPERTTFRTKDNVYEIHPDGILREGADKPAKTIFVDKKGADKLIKLKEDGKNYDLLQDDKGNYFVGDRDNISPGKMVPGTKTKASDTPERGLYAIQIDEDGNVHFDASRISSVEKNTDQRVTIGPQIVKTEEIEARKALADIAKANAEPDVQDALSKMGQHEEAATVAATRNLNNKFENVLQLGDVEAIRRNIPSLASPQAYYKNSSSLSAERARRLADEAVQASSEIGKALTDPVRVERMTAEALNRAITAAKEAVRTKYNRASDAILDQVTVWDGATNTYGVETRFGKKDGTLFDSRIQANHHRTFQYRLGSSATVEQEGNKFYLSHIQHADETAKGVREGLIVGDNITPRGLINTFLNTLTGRVFGPGASVRSSRYTTAPFQHNNKVVATHTPSILRQTIEELAKDLEALGGSWTTNERHELQRILEHNRDFMHPDGQRGKFYTSALDFEMAFKDMHGKLPTEKQIVAYDQFTRISDLDWVLRELDWHKDKVRQGVRNYQLSFTKNDAAGIPQKGKTEWFNGKKVDNFDPVNTQDANIYIMPEGRFSTKFDLKKNTVEDLLTQKKIKEGQYQIIQVYNPGSKPLHEATGIKDNIHFVVVDKFDDKALKWGENSVYRPGGHVIYQDNFFMKVPQIGTGTHGRMTHFGDTSVKSFATAKEGQAWVDKYNVARELLRTGDEAGLKAYIDAGNLPETLPEFKKLFTGGGAGLDAEHPFVLTTTGRNTFQSSEELASKYPGLKDTFSSYDLTQTQDSKFLAQRDKQLNTVANKGTEENPIYVNVPSRLYDPYTALQKGVAQIVRQRWMGDYKVSAAESWVQEFGLLFDQSKLPIDKLRQNPVYWMGHAEGNIDIGVAKANPELVAAAMTSRKNILNFIGARDEVGALLEGLERKVIEGIESIGGKKIALSAEERWLPAIKDAPAYARTGAFHAVIGMFNPVQLFQQAQGLTHVLALSPLNGLKGSTASALARLYRYTENPAILDSMADKAAALGWNKDHFREAYQAWKSSGTHNIGGEAALLSHVQDPKIFNGIGSKMLDKGTIFFKMGESVVRDTAWFTAYADWRAANLSAVLDNRAIGEIGRRFDTLSMNMTRASNAAYNEGILSPATQFWTWNARFTEQMLGKQLTMGEKARAFAAYSAMYGIPATLGGVTFGVIPMANYQDIRQYAIANNINVSDKFYQAFSEGLPALLTNSITGHTTDFQRFGPNATQVKDIIDGKKNVYEVLGGASGGFLANVMSSTIAPAFMYGFSAFKSDSQFPLKLNDLANALEVVSSFSNAEKMVIGLTLGKNVTKKEGLVDNNIDTFEAMMLSLGLQPKRDSDAYTRLEYLKHLKKVQDKLSPVMQENWKLGMAAGMRGDFQTMTDYMTRVQSLSQMAGFTKKQEIEEFRKASRMNQDLVTGAERQFREKAPILQSIPGMQKYFENIRKQ